MREILGEIWRVSGLSETKIRDLIARLGTPSFGVFEDFALRGTMSGSGMEREGSGDLERGRKT